MPRFPVPVTRPTWGSPSQAEATAHIPRPPVPDCGCSHTSPRLTAKCQSIAPSAGLFFLQESLQGRPLPRSHFRWPKKQFVSNTFISTQTQKHLLFEEENIILMSLGLCMEAVGEGESLGAGGRRSTLSTGCRHSALFHLTRSWVWIASPLTGEQWPSGHPLLKPPRGSQGLGGKHWVWLDPVSA